MCFSCPLCCLLSMQPWCGASYPMVPNLPQPEGSAGKRFWNLGGTYFQRLGIILAPSILSREIAAKTFWHHRYFGVCTFWPCKHFNTYVDIWFCGRFSIWIFQHCRRPGTNILTSVVDVTAQRCLGTATYHGHFSQKVYMFKHLECQKFGMKLFQWTWFSVCIQSKMGQGLKKTYLP